MLSLFLFHGLCAYLVTPSSCRARMLQYCTPLASGTTVATTMTMQPHATTATTLKTPALATATFPMPGRQLTPYRHDC